MKIISGIISVLSISLVVLWLCLPRFLETAIEEVLGRLDGKLQSITIEKANPWSIEMSDLSGFTKEGNFSLKKVDVRYDPVQVAEDQVQEVLVSSSLLFPCWFSYVLPQAQFFASALECSSFRRVFC